MYFLFVIIEDRLIVGCVINDVVYWDKFRKVIRIVVDYD